MQYIPERARINKVEKVTVTETYFEMELLDRKSLNHKPGQFVEVSLLGVGEVPISISSPPDPNSPKFELVVRDLGNVTKVLCSKKAGEIVGIRGPRGNGFNLDELKGKDILFIAAGLGLVPMRSLIWTVLNNRNDYGKVSILYGARNPSLILFKDEIKQFEERGDVCFQVTVDFSDSSWKGNVGVITTLIKNVDLNPKKTAAIIIGPPAMFRFVIRELQKVPDEQIYFSLERRMKCGLGKCGHCQINNVYVCQDGPVFTLAETKKLPEAI